MEKRQDSARRAEQRGEESSDRVTATGEPRGSLRARDADAECSGCRGHSAGGIPPWDVREDTSPCQDELSHRPSRSKPLAL